MVPNMRGELIVNEFSVARCGGFCSYGNLLSTTSSSSYANRSTYSAWRTPTCTAHAGWYDGYLVVNYRGLSTVPYDD